LDFTHYLTFLLHECLSHCRIFLHLVSQVNIFEHVNDLVVIPQRHVFSINSIHWLHWPLWHLCWQLCRPQLRIFWHVSPHDSVTSSEQGAIVSFLPHGQNRGKLRGHSPQLSMWHTCSHLWSPQSNGRLQTFLHLHTSSKQFLSLVSLPHTHFCGLFFLHGGHWLRSWQGWRHGWMPQASFSGHWGWEDLY
jgi:hypothetical protein